MIRALLLSTHPGPGGAVTLITIALAVEAGLDWWRVVLLAVVVALNQASVGLSNDWLDASRDRAAGRTDKPVARGELGEAAARDIAIACAALSVAASLPLGLPAVIAHLVFLASGWAYNLGLKSTPVSVLPYAVGFGTLPAIVTLAAAEPRIAAWWAILSGALLGTAAHFANVLPDLDDDAATGVRGLPHRLGRIGSVLAPWIAPPAAALVLALALGITQPIALAGLGVSFLLTAAGLALGLRRRPSRMLFRLVIAAAVVAVVMLLVGGSHGI